MIQVKGILFLFLSISGGGGFKPGFSSLEESGNGIKLQGFLAIKGCLNCLIPNIVFLLGRIQ